MSESTEAIKIAARFFAKEQNGSAYEGYESTHRDRAAALFQEIKENGFLIVPVETFTVSEILQAVESLRVARRLLPEIIDVRECPRMEGKDCHLRKCLVRGGWHWGAGGTCNYDIATCPIFELGKLGMVGEKVAP